MSSEYGVTVDAQISNTTTLEAVEITTSKNLVCPINPLYLS
jgi:hypothetical protein